MDSNQEINVVLTERHGALYELQLPAVPEGRYSFEHSKEESELPVFIQGESEYWIIRCIDGAVMRMGDGRVDTQTVLFEGIELEIKYSDHFFRLRASADCPENRVLMPYKVLGGKPVTIGSHPYCDICLRNSYVPQRIATLSRRENRWVINEDSSDCVYVNGWTVKGAEKTLYTGDIIYARGLRFAIGVNYIAISDADKSVSINGGTLLKINRDEDMEYSRVSSANTEEYFNRLPRHRNIHVPREIEIEPPPAPISDNMPMMMKMGNSLMYSARGILSGNISAAAMSAAMPMVTQAFSAQEKVKYENLRREKYIEYLKAKEWEIRNELEIEGNSLRFNYPSIDELLSLLDKKTRLWERQPSDPDFLSVRMGWGDVPMKAEKIYAARRFELETDILLEKMYELAEQKNYVLKVPVLYSLKDYFVSGILGSEIRKLILMRNMIIQLALTHSYDELKMVLIADEDCMAEMKSLSFLPHFWNNERSLRFCVSSANDAQIISKKLNELYEASSSDSSYSHSSDKNKVSYVIFAQDRELYDRIEVLKDITSDSEYRGFSVVTLFDTPIKESSMLIDARDVCKLVEIGEEVNDVITFNPDMPDMEMAEEKLRKLANIRLRLPEQQTALPNSVTFLDMYNVGKVEYLNPLNRWKENNPVKTLAAPIGIGTDGKLFTLDLHEKKQGPHGLIAGGTGSGKSEFIITYILSMAVNYSPDEVAFLLIDYKGGGLADAFVDKKKGIYLPHVVGTITNLDGASIQRSLISINSELKRRQALFSKAKSETNEGTMDIYDYQKLYRQGRVKEPLPHLFIISDEFAELKKQQPDFMDELISTARIGRSLGVHLILATQKPAGVVNDQIWSNTRFRVCLRVADKGDSMEMLKRPEAAEIRNTGRFYLQVGYNELFVQGQSGWCGAGYFPNERRSVESDKSVKFIDTAGQIILDAKPETSTVKAESKQVVAIVKYLSELAKRENIKPHMLWKEPLAEKIDCSTVNVAPEEYSSGHITALIGVTDDPEHQEQYPCMLDLQSFRNMLLVGASGMGKTVYFRSMLYSLTKKYTPEDVNFYIADLGGAGLKAFRSSPFCGAYLSGECEPEFIRLMEFMRQIAAERKKLFAEADVSSFEAYPVGQGFKKLPLILFIIDGYQNIMNSFSKGPEIYSAFNTFMTDVSGYGIRVIVSTNHSNEISTKSKQEIDERVSLCPKDKFEAAEIINGKVKMVPQQIPGRGLYINNDRVLEFHVAAPYAEEHEQTAVGLMRSELEAMHFANDASARKLPMPESGEEYSSFCEKFEKHRIPLGYRIKDMKPVALPLRQLGCIPIYFGNKFGVRPVLENLVYAAERENAKLLVVRKNEDSCFSPMNSILNGRNIESEVFMCDEAGLSSLSAEINTEILSRNAHVIAYRDMMGIPPTERGVAKKAAGYLIEHTNPVFVLFESFSDFCRCKADDVAAARFKAFIGGLKGYNIYFIGLFYPEEPSVKMNLYCEKLVGDKLQILFGGRYPQQYLNSTLPSEYRRKDKPDDNYDRFMLCYRDEWHAMIMPCGELKKPELDPDEAPVL